ncbi:MAG: DUF1801 domain-containing protein [Pseudomonadota bacterium]
MTSFENPLVKAVFESYPHAIAQKLLFLRQLIFDTAAETQGVGPLQETLKWNEPSYLTTASNSGSMIRIGWKQSEPQRYAMYFLCQTTLVETFRTIFPNEFRYGGNRSIMFEQSDAIPIDELRFCIAMALTYRLDKKSKRGD